MFEFVNWWRDKINKKSKNKHFLIKIFVLESIIEENGNNYVHLYSGLLQTSDGTTTRFLNLNWKEIEYLRTNNNSSILSTLYRYDI